MFSSNSKKRSDTINTSMINTIIGDNAKIEGVISTMDSTRVDGSLEGKILSESSVIVGESGTVKGDILAVEILVAGTVYGNLTAKEKIELTSTGKVLGDMVTKTLVIDEGASFKGNCTMEVMGEKSSSDASAAVKEAAAAHAKSAPEKKSEKGTEKGA